MTTTSSADSARAQTLASMTGWPIDDIRRRMGTRAAAADPTPGPAPWWRQVWK
jgi:hypothetical protein